ncbi:ribbon-helix-helix domain-containing protein [Muricoccus pecuniae]|uniref:Putative transcriptional regulator n=1 Tax=Muricoccus pecuniae TaxID=693023 RepID=A0A840YKP4_9PROT|nr:ribbon-helix-helix domain-containing protein [Roseomonas pecuniae]MBB5695512.1 putative transcriptional regulator [Roseomonas pecuniae]
MAKGAVLSFRINDDTKEAITRAAAAEDRSVSYIVERVLRAWLEERGFLKKVEG